ALREYHRFVGRAIKRAVQKIRQVVQTKNRTRDWSLERNEANAVKSDEHRGADRSGAGTQDSPSTQGLVVLPICSNLPCREHDTWNQRTHVGNALQIPRAEN